MIQLNPYTDLNSQDIEHSLRSLCKVWDFWTFERLIDSLKRKEYKFYYKTDINSQIWTGCLFIYKVFSISDVIYFFIFEEYRRKKIGLQFLEDYWKSYCLSTEEKIILEVRASNHSAIKTYSKFGMRMISKRRKYYRDGEDALIFIKDRH